MRRFHIVEFPRVNASASLLSADESTDGFDKTTGNPHDENFVNVRAF